jgi:hypothetical protein
MTGWAPHWTSNSACGHFQNGPSRAAAERALKLDLVSRQAPLSGGAITMRTRVRVLADAWLDAPNNWSITTDRLYRTIVEKDIKPVAITVVRGRSHDGRRSLPETAPV